jgi:hypothetical protein
MPTLTIEKFTQATIRMVLEGLPKILNETQQGEWEKVTDQHVRNYYAEFEADFPELVPVNVTNVTTAFIGQKVLNPGWGDRDDRLQLEIVYSQEIEVRVYDKELETEEIEFFVFIAPFEYDSQAYLVALFEELGLKEWIYFNSIAFPTPSPTNAPTPNNDGPFSGGATAALSVSIVFILCVIAYVFWDRFKKEDRYRASQQEQVNETMEYDNAGQPVDWRNPYNDQHNNPNGLPPPPPPSPPPQDADAPPRTNSSSGHHRSGSNATIPTQNSHSRHSSRGDGTSILPPLPPPSNSSRYRSGGPVPRLTEDNMRHTSITDTELTDITYSDGGGGGRSDSGSDLNTGMGPQMQLSTIHDERYVSIDSENIKTKWLFVVVAELTLSTCSSYYFSRFQDDSAPLSPLHIPDEDTIKLVDLSPPPSPPTSDLLGLAVDCNSPS